ncbi:MAG: hypothetical protein A3K67_02800 [Euryarchaeota archaeon RBG_16_62_10]|nr:MAG: hypothetical protein A3K67_02800 [Euryarchaeota archaeon RBG_16_62_10]
MTQQVLPLQKEKAIEIGEFLTNNVSRAVVYALMHRQPMTRREIEKSPLTDSMRRLSLSAQTRPLKDKSAVQMRTLLAKGVDCGVLVAMTSKRQNYYFLNSDLRIEPSPIREGVEQSDEVALNAFLDRSFAHTPGQAVLPGWGTAADHTILPVPYIDTPKSLMLWLGWMITPTRRQILSHIGLEGSTNRPKLRSGLGFWADRIVAKEGLPSGVLERMDGQIRYQFSTFSFSKIRTKKEEEGRKKSWTTYPPSFWLTRSYEPLRCIMGASKYLPDKKPDATPMMVLEEIAKEEPTVVEKNRREFLEVNFMERMSFYAVYHSSGDSAVKVSADALVPEKVTFNAPEHPLVWISRTDEDHAGARLDFKHEAAQMLMSRKTKEEQIAFLEKMLKDLAMDRIGRVLEEHERALGKELERLRMQSFGLGADSISAVAGLELGRENVLTEKHHFEKFMELLVPGSIPKKRRMETEELLAAIEKGADPGRPDASEDKEG